MHRLIRMFLSLLVAAAMMLTSLPEAFAAPSATRTGEGLSTLCTGAGCTSVLDAYGAKKHKASHKRPAKRPAAKPGRPGKPGMNRPGKPGKPGYKPGRPGANTKPARPDYRPGKPNRPGYKPGRPGDHVKPNRPGYRPGKPNKPNYGHHHRPPNWHHRPVHYRPYYRPWRHRDWYGAMFAGVMLGTIIAVAANTQPAPPSSELCWYWSNNMRTQGYWDYCY